MELWQCVMASSTEQVTKCTVIIAPCLSKELGNALAHSPLLRGIKGLIDIHGSSSASIKLVHLRAALQDEGKRERKKLPLYTGNSHSGTVWS